MSGCFKTKTEPVIITISDKNLNSSHIIADTIIYSVDIINYDQNDEWAAWRLRHMNTSKLVEDILGKVYAGKLKAYDYFTDKLLTIEDIERLESDQEYSRSQIEEIQFEETWFFSSDQQHFHKEVHSIVLAYALYTEEGLRRGLKPVFRVRLNSN
jgi:hypothetical protein